MNRDLTVGKPRRVLWKFCLPLFGSIFFQQLYSIADSLIAGKFIGEGALAAVGNSYVITLIYLAVAFGCNMGCSVIVSQLFGAKDYKAVSTAVYTTLIYSGALCILLMAAGFGAGGLLLRLIHTAQDIFSDSKLYLHIYTGGLLFLFYYNIAAGVFTALGDSKTPFLFLSISSMMNIFVDILFVKCFGMGVAGVAWATFICQGISCVASMAVVLKRLNSFQIDDGKSEIFSFSILKRMLRISIPITLQQAVISVGNVLIQGCVNSFGSSVTAGYAAAIKLNDMVIAALMSFDKGVASFTAQNFGAGKPERVKSGFYAGLPFAVALSISLVTVFLLFSKDLVNLFMDSEKNKALEVGMGFLRTVSPFYIIVAVKIVSDGVLRGIGAMKQLITGTFTDLMLRVCFAFLLSSIWGAAGIWAAWPVGWVSGTILSVLFTARLTIFKRKL